MIKYFVIFYVATLYLSMSICPSGFLCFVFYINVVILVVFLVVGIISGLQAEGSKIYAPNVYTRVSAYLDWINQNIQDGEC